MKRLNAWRIGVAEGSRVKPDGRRFAPKPPERTPAERIAFCRGQLSGIEIMFDAMATCSRFDGDDLHFMWLAMAEAKESIKNNIVHAGAKDWPVRDGSQEVPHNDAASH